MGGMEKSNRGYAANVKKVRRQWLLLAYRIPREPSTPRISVWRKLRQLGAAQIVDGLVALPAENRTREQFGWLAHEIREAAGDAWIWESVLATLAQEEELVAGMMTDVASEYAAITASARALEVADAVPARALARLRRELHRIEARDYFGSPSRRKAANAVELLAKTQAKDASGAPR